MAEMLYDDIYAGPRWRYGLNYRPLGYAQVPPGSIVFSHRPSVEFRFGTIEYPRQLTEEEVDGYELTAVELVTESSR